MAKSTKQKGKKTNNSTTPTVTTNSAEEQINRAKAAVEQNRHSTATLHSQWRGHLVRLSYMLILITIHQLQAPTTNCLYDIKSYNKSLTPLDDDSLRISALQALLHVLNDSLCECLGVVMGACITIFLTQLHRKAAVRLVNNATGATVQESFVTNHAYMVSTALVPAVLNFYFTKSNHPTTSCLDGVLANPEDGLWTRHADPSVGRGFPVIIVFHTIATACCWFIDMQQAQQNKNLALLEALKRDLAKGKKKK